MQEAEQNMTNEERALEGAAMYVHPLAFLPDESTQPGAQSLGFEPAGW